MYTDTYKTAIELTGIQTDGRQFACYATNERTGGRTEKWKNGRTNGRTDGRTNGRTDGRTDGRTVARTGERTDGRMDG